VRNRSGQFALLGVIVLAVTILALVALRSTEPAFAYERGPMQSAQLIHLARYCLAIGCNNDTLMVLVKELVKYNASEPLLMYPVLDAYYEENISSTRAVDHVSFTVQTLRGPEKVEVVVVAQAYGRQNVISKTVRGVSYVLKNTTLMYRHEYLSPFFPSRLEYCPRIYDPSGVAEVRSIGPCFWAVAVPIDYNLYTLFDEFNIPVKVVVP